MAMLLVDPSPSSKEAGRSSPDMRAKASCSAASVRLLPSASLCCPEALGAAVPADALMPVSGLQAAAVTASRGFWSLGQRTAALPGVPLRDQVPQLCWRFMQKRLSPPALKHKLAILGPHRGSLPCLFQCPPG